MRLFFAAMLPRSVQTRLGTLRAGLDWLPARAAWSAPANLHITLKFLGEVPDEKVNELAIGIGKVIPAVGEIVIRPSGLLFFPPRGNARVLAVGFEGQTGKLIEVQAAIESACHELGFPLEGRGYVPHATLARFRDGLRPVHSPRVEQSCTAVARMPEFAMDEVQLMHSTLSSRGAQYAVVARYPLV